MSNFVELNEADNLEIDLSEVRVVEIGDKPSQTKTTTPTKERQFVRADAGFELTENIVEPIPDEYIIPAGAVEIKSNGRHDVKGVEFADVNVPTEIPEGYINPQGTIELKTNGEHNVREFDMALVNVPTPEGFADVRGVSAESSDILAGKTFVNKNGELKSGTIETYAGGTTIVPTKAKQVVETQNKYVSANIEVEPIGDEYIIPEGEVLITDNNRTYDVTNAKTAKIEVPIPEPKLQKGSASENGVYTPDEGFDGFSEFEVDVASSGGGTTSGEFFVRVIDYDGTLLDEQWLNNGDVYTVPVAPPEKERHIFQEWSSSQEIVDGKIIIDNNNVMIGAIYTTKSGFTEIKIEINDSTGNSFTCNINGYKNWGDGTRDELNTHNYAEHGEYIITCEGTTASSKIFGSGTTHNYAVKAVYMGTNVVGSSSYDFEKCYTLEEVSLCAGYKGTGGFDYCYSLKAMVLPSGFPRVQYLFRQDYTLSEVVLPFNMPSFGNGFFTSTYCLKNFVIPKSITDIYETSGLMNFVEYVVIPESVTSIRESALNNFYSLKRLVFKNNPTGISSALNKAYSLREISIPDSVETIASSMTDCYNLEKIKFPKNLNSFNGCNNCYSLKIADFRDCLVVPTASSVPFNYCYGVKIIVPDALYDEWVSATNWATRANQIYKASEVEL